MMIIIIIIIIIIVIITILKTGFWKQNEINGWDKI